MPKTCPNCGGNISLAPNSRVEQFKGLSLLVPGVRVPTCDVCEEQFISPRIADEMQAALENAHQQFLHRELMEAMARLKEHQSLASIARMLGYSQGYFSKLRRRERNLTTHLVALLKHLALEPEQRLGELAQMFERPIKVSSSGELVDKPITAGPDSDGERVGPN